MRMLPKVDYPVFELVIPSTKKAVKFRPYTVKEEKMLLIAYRSGETKDIENGLKQVIQNCVISKDFDATKLRADFASRWLLALMTGVKRRPLVPSSCSVSCRTRSLLLHCLDSWERYQRSNLSVPVCLIGSLRNCSSKELVVNE